MYANRTHWHASADVVVLGYGSAGAVAAITAHDAGASVTIIEKQAADQQLTSSFMAAGLVICPNDEAAARRHLEVAYRAFGSQSWVGRDVIAAWARYSVDNMKWLERIGVTAQLYRHGGTLHLPDAESIDVYLVRGRGPLMMKAIYKQVAARGIPVRYGVAATNLLTDSRGEVIGVKGRGARGEVVNVQARRAVVLATGGFEFNEPMKLQYLRIYPTYFTASPALTGDGVNLGLEVGAQLWHMNCCSASYTLKFPGVPHRPAAPIRRQGPGDIRLRRGGAGGERELDGAAPGAAVGGFIIADGFGKRYTDENVEGSAPYYALAAYDSKRLLYPRVPSYWIFDQRRMADGYLVNRISGPAGPAGIYKWSPDNSAELAKGWIKQGSTIRQLAARLGMDSANLAETVANYNRYCAQGRDPEFGREPGTLVPLDSPPYYGVRAWPGGPNTQGGPRRNAKAQVLRANGAPVPRLYSAGELGSIYGMLYPSSGGNLAECIAFGRIAGENAATYRPR